MLTYFPMPYKDELFYSNIARFNFYSGNTNAKDTLKSVFGSDTTIPTVSFPSRLNYLVGQLDLKVHITEECFIKKHSLFPLYEPFLSQKRQESIVKCMKYGTGEGVYAKIGFVAGSICEKKRLEYCPECVKQDNILNGEPYFHRVHQVQGLLVCPVHSCYLKKYLVPTMEDSRIKFIRLEYEKADLLAVYEGNKIVYDELCSLSHAIQYILEHDLSNFNNNIIHKKLIKLLEDKDLVTVSGSIRQNELFKQFVNWINPITLSMVESEIDNDKEYNWIKILTRKPTRVIHPLRNILFILFLSGSIEEFFSNNKVKPYTPFGEGPWPCLNSVSGHYRRDLINTCSIKEDYKTKKTIGTFECSCGFIYSRSGPDITEEDKYKIGAIKDYGVVWENKLKECTCEQIYSLRKLAKIMRCDPKTIIKYCKKLMIIEFVNTKNKITNIITDRDKKMTSECIENQYKEDLLNYIAQNPLESRKQIRDNLKKQFGYLYRHNKEWMYQTLPAITSNQNYTNNRVDWEIRDNDILKKLKEAYLYLYNLEKPVRISKSLLAKKIVRDAILYKKIDKLPYTKKYLDNIIETVKDFQLRKVAICCDAMSKEGVEIKKWKVIRKAGLRSEYADKLSNEIDFIINKSKGIQLKG